MRSSSNVSQNRCKGEVVDTQVFSGFSEFWSLTKHLTSKQRQVILRSLSKAQRDKLQKSYLEEGWEDLFIRNELDGIIDEIQKQYKWNLLEIRGLVLRGREVFIRRSFWEEINKQFKGYSPRHIFYIFGGYRVVEVDNREEYKLVPVEGK